MKLVKLNKSFTKTLQTMDTSQSIYQQIRELSALEKLQLAELLLADLDNPDPGIDAMWGAEAEKRWQAYREGKMKTVSYTDAMQKYK
jgi:putative addiction module component (TIGR02574 family)